MNRREFCRLVALSMSGGLLAEQVDALARTYLISSQHVPEGQLVSVHDIYIGFDCPPCDGTAVINFWDGDRLVLPVAMNTRASLRWGAMPTDAIMTSVDRFRWTATDRLPVMSDHGIVIEDDDLSGELCGWVKWLDEDGKQQTTPLQHHSKLIRA